MPRSRIASDPPPISTLKKQILSDGITTASPWFDKHPLLDPARPEVRKYRLRCWDKGEANGDWTVVGKITVSP